MIFRVFCALVFAIILTGPVHAKCNARFLNPITDVCWDCLFPLSVGSIKIPPGVRPDTANPPMPICLCPGFPLPRPGLTIGIWEPARLVDVANETGCFVNLGFDMDFGLMATGKTSATGGEGSSTGSKWHVHYYYYPLLSILGTAIDALCLESTAFDVAWISEIDPLWMDAELSMLLNPETILFANEIAQSACAADCVKASSGTLPIQELFWCDGCNGPLYPVTGDANQHTGGVQASSVVMGKMLQRMHRIGLARRTAYPNNLCQPQYSPVIQKDQYRRQITRPSAKTNGRFAGAPIGASSQFYSTMREVPYVGESFGYLIWRKRNCCAL